MGLVKLLLVVVGLYLAQSYYLTSASHIESFLTQHNLLSMQDTAKACEDYSDTLQASIYQKSPTETLDIKGGKAEVCNMLQQYQAAMRVTQGSMTGHFDNLQVKSGFPWQKATAEYDDINQVTMGKMTITSKTHDIIEIKRTLTGLTITKLTSNGVGEVK